MDHLSKENFPQVRLEIHKIFGRKAFNRKNNLVISQNKQLIYSAGTNLIEIYLHDSINRCKSKSDELE